MDAKKLGLFIAEVRKEQGMTQSDLAQKIHVTDKAVSRWERGLGFPDINTIEPLADALGVSIIELMNSRRIQEETIDKKESLTVYQETIDVIKQKRKRNNKILAISFLLVVCLLSVFFLYPMKLEKQISDTQNLVLMVTRFQVEDGQPVLDQSSYTLEPGTMEFVAFRELMGGYTYHRNFLSFFPDSEFKGGDFYISIYSGEKLLSFSQNNQINIDGHSYTLGYFGEQSGKELISELQKTLPLLEEK